MYFYKTVLVYNDSVAKGIGFIFPHEKSGKDLFEYAVTIDSVETVTGYDFHHRLPKRKQNKVESSVNINFWKN